MTPFIQVLADGMIWQPGGASGVVIDEWSSAVWSDRPSAMAAASHSLFVEMRAPPQEPLPIM